MFNKSRSDFLPRHEDLPETMFGKVTFRKMTFRQHLEETYPHLLDTINRSFEVAREKQDS